jgi:hypothetical protein
MLKCDKCGDEIPWDVDGPVLCWKCAVEAHPELAFVEDLPPGTWCLRLKNLVLTDDGVQWKH